MMNSSSSTTSSRIVNNNNNGNNSIMFSNNNSVSTITTTTTTTTTNTTNNNNNSILSPSSSNSLVNNNNNSSSSSNNGNGNISNNSSKLIDAARKGNVDLVQKLLKKDLKKLLKRDDRGDSCLHKAALFGHVDCIEAILKIHSNSNSASISQSSIINAKNNEGYTPLMYAILNGYRECAKVLLLYNADANDKLPSNPGIPLSYSVTNSVGVYTWKIDNFSKIKDRKVFSNTFLVSGCSWKLVAYPKGSKSDENLSLYLEVANHDSLADGWFHLVTFTFMIVNHLDPKNKVKREVVAHRFHRHHTDLGFSQILKKEMLKDKKSGWLQNDQLVIEFKIDIIQNTSYFDDESSSVYTWKLQKVSTLRERAISPIFKVGLCKWMIAVYPKGKNGGDHLSIYLKVAETIALNQIQEWFFLVNFKFSVINQKDGSKFTRQVEGKKFKANVEDWGFPQFIKLHMLYDTKSGFINPTDDSILIELQMEIISDFSRKKFKDNVTDWGLTLLHWVAYKGSYEGVKFLLSNGANPNVTDYKGRTPLDWCAYNGDLPTSEVLISTGMADVNCKDHEGFTPLHKAVMNGHLEVARLLVRYGAVNVKNIACSSISPLSLAIRVSRLWCVESLIKWGADINVPDKQGRAPLHWAICSSESRLISLLLKYGLPNNNNNHNNNSSQRNNNDSSNHQHHHQHQNSNGSVGSTGSGNHKHLSNELNFIDDIAESSDNLDSENNETQNQSEGQEHLEDTTDSDEDQSLYRLNNNNQLSGSPSTSTTTNNIKDDKFINNNNNNNTIIYLNNNEYHFQNNHYEEFVTAVVPLQVNVKDQDGYTPLHKAVWKGKLAVIRLLLEKGADPKLVTKDGCNAVHISVAGNEMIITQLLLDHSPQCIHTFDENGHTPLHKAAVNGNLVMMDMLIQRGADVNLCSPAHSDVSPLSEALKESDISCIIFLLQRNADPKRCQKSLLNLIYKRLKILRYREIENTIPKCTLSSDMKYLLNNDNYKDVTFIVESKPIYAYKGILCARSDYFRAMFEQPLKESLENEVRIESVDYSTFLQVMEYIYTGELSNKLTLEESMLLLIAANRFMLPRLKQLCESFITKEFNIDNIYNIFKLADMHESTLLLSECVRYLAENHLYIPETDDIVKIPSFRKSVLEFLSDSLNI